MLGVEVVIHTLLPDSEPTLQVVDVALLLLHFFLSRRTFLFEFFDACRESNGVHYYAGGLFL